MISSTDTQDQRAERDECVQVLDGVMEKNVKIRGRIADFWRPLGSDVENSQHFSVDHIVWIQSVNESLEAEHFYMKAMHQTFESFAQQMSNRIDHLSEPRPPPPPINMDELHNAVCENNQQCMKTIDHVDEEVRGMQLLIDNLAQQLGSRIDQLIHSESSAPKIDSNFMRQESERAVDKLEALVDGVKQESMATFELVEQDMKTMHEAFDGLAVQLWDKVENLRPRSGTEQTLSPDSLQEELPDTAPLTSSRDELRNLMDESRKQTSAKFKHVDHDMKALQQALADQLRCRIDEIGNIGPRSAAPTAESLGESTEAGTNYRDDLRSFVDECHKDSTARFEHVENEMKAMHRTFDLFTFRIRGQIDELSGGDHQRLASVPENLEECTKESSSTLRRVERGQDFKAIHAAFDGLSNQIYERIDRLAKVEQTGSVHYSKPPATQLTQPGLL